MFIEGDNVCMLSSVVSSNFKFLALAMLARDVAPSSVNGVRSFLALSALFCTILL